MKMTFVTAEGTERTVEAAEGASVMSLAVNNDVPGIEGECGGEMSCGTCHVYVDDAWAGNMPRMGEDEEDMLDVVEDRRPGSRLSCQITMRADLDGLRVTVAEA
ncbi:2Fe-2S iron-sulfur cluster-binding protein [Actinomadura sp. LOL_016]|uniref:2Fe-2S iron-sulfur cluster-binding protein n=1 Tax=unclassified Actinomadura TaxID=2626254 RepID=UPI003A7FE270